MKQRGKTLRALHYKLSRSSVTKTPCYLSSDCYLTAALSQIWRLCVRSLEETCFHENQPDVLWSYWLLSFVFVLYTPPKLIFSIRLFTLIQVFLLTSVMHRLRIWSYFCFSRLEYKAFCEKKYKKAKKKSKTLCIKNTKIFKISERNVFCSFLVPHFITLSSIYIYKKT